LIRKLLSGPQFNLMRTSKRIIRISLRAVLGAPKSTLIQRYIGLINIKFSELRIVKMKQNCAIIEMSKNLPLQQTRGDTLFPAPAPAGPQCSSPV